MTARQAVKSRTRKSRANKTATSQARKTTAKRNPKPRPSSAAASPARSARSETDIVRRYLDALVQANDRRVRLRPETIQAQLEAVNTQLTNGVSTLERLHLHQRRIDLQHALDRVQSTALVDDGQLEAEFVTVAASFSARKGITYASWREVGVPAAVLRRAEVRR